MKLCIHAPFLTMDKFQGATHLVRPFNEMQLPQLTK